MSAIRRALALRSPSSKWARSELREIYETPLLELVFQAQTQHRQWQNPGKVQLCTLMNIKTGGCTEDCKYCSQSSRHDAGVKAEKLVSVEEVVKEALEAKKNGSTRFCLGAAWRDMHGRRSGLKRIGQMVKEINNMGMESCVTLGMVTESQAKDLKDAGLTAYNHNIDTSREHYPKVISTRSYDDRLETIKNVSRAGVQVCTGGILGLGETVEDHIGFLHTLSNMDQHPESVPINKLIAIKGTAIVEDLKDRPPLSLDSIVRTIATARLVMPRSIVRLAAGRYTMKEHEQFLCFMAGCNAIFTGKKMLTTLCTGWDEDKAMLERWGLTPMEPKVTASEHVERPLPPIY